MSAVALVELEIPTYYSAGGMRVDAGYGIDEGGMTGGERTSCRPAGRLPLFLSFLFERTST